MSAGRAGLLGVLLVCSAFRLPHPAFGQEVRWRDDYNRARQEAADTNRPLIIDFGTVNCHWCRQLDATTFRDPQVVTLLNERCVPLKVDAQRSPALVEALKIAGFPTLVYAAPDGRILGFQEGYVEGPRLRDQLGRVLAAAGGPARETREQPEVQAAERLAQGRRLIEQGQTDRAVGVLSDMTRTHAGTVAAREASRILLELTQRPDGGEARQAKARDLLARARDDHRAQHFLCALDRCETLAAQYGDLPEGVEATALAAEIKGNPEWAERAAEQMSDRLAVLYLSLAESWQRKGETGRAAACLERVVQTFPGSRHAEVARGRLAQLQGPAPAGSDKR
jgi:thioredoxin-like negative regulator of GroEL